MTYDVLRNVLVLCTVGDRAADRAGTSCSYRIYLLTFLVMCGPGSVVDIATGYGLDGSGIESPRGRDFPHLSRPALRPTQPPVQWVPGLSPGVKSGRGVTLTFHPFLVPWS
jgi:hypothetical protein